MKRWFLICLVVILGCGSGGVSTESSPRPIPIIHAIYEWEPPMQFEDNTILDPYRDLRGYYLYVTLDGVFNDNTVEVAEISSIDNNGNLVRSFDLEGLIPFISDNECYICIKSIAVNNQLSGFSQPCLWEK